MNAHEMAKAEFQRMLDGGLFDEGFWQRLYNPSRDEMYRLQRERDGEIYLLQADARMMADLALTGNVQSKRAARKAAERVHKFRGVLRHRKMHAVPDMINVAWRESVQWISDARDAAVYIQRMNNGLKNPVSVLEVTIPEPVVSVPVKTKPPRISRAKPKPRRTV
jgi:hypothetical protein